MASNEKTEVIFTKEQRFRRALYWVVVSAALANWVSYQTGSLETLWFGENHWFLAIYLGLTFVPAFVIYRVRSGVKLSPEAAKATLAFTFDYPPQVTVEKANITDEPFEASDVNSMTVMKELFNSTWVRYPVALLCFWIAFRIPATVEVPIRITIGLAFVCLGFYLAREVMIWAVGLVLAGLAIWGLFAGVSALNVPAAIIVGALIIAFSMGH